MNRKPSFLIALGLIVGMTGTSGVSAQSAEDSLVKALGPEIINGAKKEGSVTWYGGSSLRKFIEKHKAIESLQERFGIKLEYVVGKTNAIYQRIATEISVGRQVADFYWGNEQYANRMIEQGVADSWHPPATELDKLRPWVKVNIQGKDQYFPLSVSPQALMVNTEAVAPKEYPQSYWDIVNNPAKWTGRVALRDPRSASGGAWMMMAIKHTPSLGLDFIKKLATVKPNLISGGSKRLRNVVAKKQFDLGFNGRGEFIVDMPKGTPIEYVVPKEGFSWTRNGLVRLKNSPHPMASKVLLAWMFQLEQLQGWTDIIGRPVPHPDVKVPIPQMSVVNYPAMPPIPEKNFANPDPFFKEMEQIFGIR